MDTSSTPGPFGQSVGLTQREAQRFDFGALVRAVVTGDREGLAFYHDVSRATAEKIGRETSAPMSFFVPADVLERQPARRDMTVAGVAGSNLLVGQSIPTFGGIYRTASLIESLPLVKITGLVGNVSIPKVTALSSGWLAGEDAVATEGQPTIGTVSLLPRSCAAFYVVSHQLRAQAAPGAGAFIEGQLARELAAAENRALLAGSGLSGEPQSPFAAVGTVSEAGASMTWAKTCTLVKAAETAASGDNVRVVIGTDAAAVLRQKERASGSGFVLDGGQVAGYPAIVSGDAPAGRMFAAAWDTIVAGRWSAIEVTIAPYGRNATDFSKGLAVIRAMTMLDYAPLQPSALASTSGTIS